MLNFKDAGDYSERLFDYVKAMDQYTERHYLPLYLSKVTNPDQSILNFDEGGHPVRGVRTFGECAHYVRCIPYHNREYVNIENAIWCSPDFTLNIKTGTEIDHALLLASIFRTIKFEDREEFKKHATE